MQQELKQLYQTQVAVRVVVYGCLLLCAVLLYTLSGGFPPWAWRFLASLLPRLPELWQAQGPAMLVPFIGLLLLSLSLLILWMILLTVTLRLLFHQWRERYEEQRFARELAEADALSEELLEEVLDNEYTQPERVAAPAMSRASRRPYMAQAARSTTNNMYEDIEDDECEEEEPQPASMGLRLRASQPVSPLAPTQEVDVPQREGLRSARTPLASQASRTSATWEELEEPRRAQAFGSSTPAIIPARPVARQTPAETPVPEWPGTAYPAITSGPSAPPSGQSCTGYGFQFATGIEKHAPLPQAVNDTPQPVRIQQAAPIELAAHQHARAAGTVNSINQASIAPISDDIEEYDTRPVQAEEEEEYVDEEMLPQEGSSEPQYRLSVGMGLDPGLVRKDAPNEDNIFAMQGIRPGSSGPEPVGLFVVADGMGGHADGQEASRLAIQIISDIVSPTLLREAELEESFGGIIKDATHRANLTLYQRNRQKEHMMGTTLTTALVIGTMAHVINVGDSRTYRYRPSEGLSQITRDHSVVARLVEKGLIEPHEVYTHPKRNQIYRCLGEHASVEFDYFKVELQERDILLLCSDGLWEMVRDPEIKRILSSANTHASRASSLLIQAALAHGGHDNISVVIACMLAEE
jgi:serine/threonine protein phosphatase PrpC